jgi:YesN/AraC family two-component response regulator
MLVTTHMSVEEIAGAVGYMNVNNFVQIFKKKEDITPLQYRKKFSAL